MNKQVKEVIPMVDSDGKPILNKEEIEKTKDGIESIKSSRRTRSHLIAPSATQKMFKTNDELVADAEKVYSAADNKFRQSYEADKANGLDINDVESIKKFEVGYTPLTYTLLVKFLYEEKKFGKIIIPDSSSLGNKAVVIVPGALVDNIVVGDILMLKPFRQTPNHPEQFPPHHEKIFNNITFQEIAYEAIAGIFMSRSNFMDRSDRMRIERIKKEALETKEIKNGKD